MMMLAGPGCNPGFHLRSYRGRFLLTAGAARIADIVPPERALVRRPIRKGYPPERSADGRFRRNDWQVELHPRFKTPYKAVLFIGGLSAFALLFGRQALIWPHEWAIVAGWWIVGLGLPGFRIWSDRYLQN